jgi:hypothetical protein
MYKIKRFWKLILLTVLSILGFYTGFYHDLVYAYLSEKRIALGICYIAIVWLYFYIIYQHSELKRKDTIIDDLDRNNTRFFNERNQLSDQLRALKAKHTKPKTTKKK